MSDPLFDDSPLNDDGYEPSTHPADGRPPEVVARWGPKSQFRWFGRFQGELKPMPYREWENFYCDSPQHRGLCCASCIEDKNTGYGDDIEDCCCRALHTP